MKRIIFKAVAFLCSGLPAFAGAAESPAILSPAIPPQIIIAPTEIRADPTLAQGCWIRLFPEAGYKGQDDLTIAGPIDIPALQAPSGNVYWRHKPESFIAGPNATIIAYENQSFRGPSASIKAGTRETNLREGLRLMQSIDSLIVRCKQ
ncbi:hypothetical protein [Noviherbaspirillum aerium]|uniref:hypothetical protein n=1 Tax=Noviherbaspirillum aerium TaxID=2588497 RepID=UPI00124D1C01|nr:hypothetical protein [Noviherbaspirillum aerium]